MLTMLALYTLEFTSLLKRAGRWCVLVVLPLLLSTPLLADTRLEEATWSSGALNLQSADWGEGHIYALDGDWRLLPGQWLDPVDRSTEAWQNSQGVTVPGFWNQGETASIPTFGIATLARRIQVPAGIPVFLALSDVPSAYRLYLNGQLMETVGQPGHGPEDEIPQFRPVLVEATAPDGNLDIVLQISNFHYKQFGVRRSLQLTDASGYAWLREAPLLFDFFFCGVLMTMASLLIGRYLRQRNERTSLYLGLFSLMVGSRALLVGERVLYQIDWFAWSTLQKAEHILLYGSFAVFVAYLYELIDGGISRRFVQILSGISCILILLVLLLPVHLGTQTVVPFKWMAIAAVIYVVQVYWPLLRARGAGVFWFAASFVILLGSLVIDLINQNLQIQSRPIVHWGMILFVVCQSLFLNHVRVWRKQRLADSQSTPVNEPVVTTLFSELGVSRQKIEDLETQLLRLREDLVGVVAVGGRHAEPSPPEVRPIDAPRFAARTLDSRSQGPQKDETPPPESPPPETSLSVAANGLVTAEDSREALVELLRTSLGLWERYAGKSKVQLAEESRCWRVYVDGSTVKTRTFDKYLRLKDLPSKPRWRLVTRTAYFVLENAPLPGAETAALSRQISEIEKAFS